MPNTKRYDPAARQDVEWWHIVIMAAVVSLLVIPVAIYPFPAHTEPSLSDHTVDK